MDDTKWVIDLSGVFLFLGVITVFEVLSFWMWISHPIEASLGTIFSKQLSNTVKINAFPSPLRLTCYATSADTKPKLSGRNQAFPRLCLSRMLSNKKLRNRNSGLFGLF